jgi:drug/metabolite transporter (DMT)-like permease
MSNSSKGILFATITALLWGVIAIVLKLALTHLAPIDVTWVRFAMSFAFFVIYFLFKEPKALRIIIHPPILLIVASFCLGFNFLGFITGVGYTTPSIAQVFIQLAPVLFAISGFIFFKEKVSKRQLFGLFLVICGLIVFYREQIVFLSQDLIKYRKGVTWTFFGAFMWSIYAIFHKILVKSHQPLHLNLLLFSIPALLFIPFVNFNSLLHASLLEWGFLLFLGINTVLAYGSLGYAFKYLEANKVSVIITLNPIITFILMFIFGVLEVGWIVHENFTPITMIGALMVILGTIFTILRRKRKTAKENIAEETICLYE